MTFLEEPGTRIRPSAGQGMDGWTDGGGEEEKEEELELKERD